MSTFIISIRYIAPIEQVDALMGPHVKWLREQHRAGNFHAWGRKVPREGGIIVASGGSHAEVEALAAQDPFVTGGVAEAEVIEWSPSFAADGFEGLKP
jgi:uncharacterized protein YciI